MALQRLYEAAEKAKIELSSTQETQINLPFITATAEAARSTSTSQLTRAEAQRADRATCSSATVGPVKQALADAGRRAKIDHVVLVGGMTRMPGRAREGQGARPARSRTRASTRTRSSPSAPRIQAGVLAGEVKDVLLLDVTPLTLGIETKGGVMTKLIERNTTIPTKKSEVFLDRRRQPALGGDPRAPGRARDGHLQQDAWASSSSPASRRRRAACPQIEVTFDIDANGIINVSAKDLGTGKRAEDRDQVRLRALRRGDPADGLATPSRTPTRTASARAGRGPQRRRERGLPGGEAAHRARASRVDEASEERDRGGRSRTSRARSTSSVVEEMISAKTEALRPRDDQRSPKQIYAAAAGRSSRPADGGRPRTAAAATTRRRSSTPRWSTRTK